MMSRSYYTTNRVIPCQKSGQKFYLYFTLIMQFLSKYHSSKLGNDYSWGCLVSLGSYASYYTTNKVIPRQGRLKIDILLKENSRSIGKVLVKVYFFYKAKLKTGLTTGEKRLAGIYIVHTTGCSLLIDQNYSWVN